MFSYNSRIYPPEEALKHYALEWPVCEGWSKLRVYATEEELKQCTLEWQVCGGWRCCCGITSNTPLAECQICSQSSIALKWGRHIKLVDYNLHVLLATCGKDSDYCLEIKLFKSDEVHNIFQFIYMYTTCVQLKRYLCFFFPSLSSVWITFICWNKSNSLQTPKWKFIFKSKLIFLQQ